MFLLFGVELSATAKEAKYFDLLRVDDECNRDPTLEADNAQSRTDVVAPPATLGEDFETEAIFRDPVDISSGNSLSRSLGNPPA